MATELFWGTDAPSNNCYFSVWNSSGNVFDDSDNTFKALGSATTPGLAATERTAMGGVNESAYDASVNLADIHSSLAIGVYRVAFYRRLGGSPAPSTDLQLGMQEIRISGGELVSAGTVGTLPDDVEVHLSANVTSTLGDYVQLYCWLTRKGKFYPVPDTATCYFQCYENEEDGDGLLQFRAPDTGTISPHATQDAFETTQEAPNFENDQGYWLIAYVEIDSVTITGKIPLPCIGGGDPA